jgi:hypothetical protein
MSFNFEFFFYAYNGSNWNIIAYADGISTKRLFKITYSRGIYLAYIKKRRKYESLCESPSLHHCIEICEEHFKNNFIAKDSILRCAPY